MDIRDETDSTESHIVTVKIESLEPLPKDSKAAFNFLQHEYWRLGQVFQQLCSFRDQLEAWEDRLRQQRKFRKPRRYPPGV